MSTRCNIVVSEKRRNETVKCFLYHHHDGMLEGVGADLRNFLKDKTYWYLTDIVNDLIKNKDDDEYEYTTGIHGDIDYCYYIDCDAKTLKCEVIRITYNASTDEYERVVSETVQLIY